MEGQEGQGARRGEDAEPARAHGRGTPLTDEADAAAEAPRRGVGRPFEGTVVADDADYQRYLSELQAGGPQGRINFMASGTEEFLAALRAARPKAKRLPDLIQLAKQWDRMGELLRVADRVRARKT